MNAFEKVIGYETVKNEIMQICDMVHNKERYEALGAKMPQGVLIHGEPGLGKTLLAKCFIEECNINTYKINVLYIPEIENFLFQYKNEERQG